MMQLKLDYKRILQHLAFWVVLVGFTTFIYGYSYKSYSYGTMLWQVILSLPIDLTAVYFTLYFLIPRYLYPKKYFLLILFFVLSAFAISTMQTTYNAYFIIPYFYPDSPSAANPQIFTRSFFFELRSIYYTVFIAVALKMLKQWYLHQQMRKELEKQSLVSELTMLRQQISPHFLFNTLNNIDTLIFKDKHIASDSIMRLSEIMRYMLYEAKTDEVTLEDEIKYLESYIELFKLGLKDKDLISYQIQGNPAGKRIAPMIFIPFIENAFKHGNKNSMEKPAIAIKLKIENEAIYYSVSNFTRISSETADKTSGIGLKNVKRRLELLYPNLHELTIYSQDRKFIVELMISLNHEYQD